MNCFICNSSKLTGLSNLPHGSHLVLAPFATAQRTDEPEAPWAPRSPMVTRTCDRRPASTSSGVPLANAAIDATFNPDFSQVESDAAQIVANERFALFYPEKRPFFLEGVDLFSTPLQAVYTRTVTDRPARGCAPPASSGTTAYTALVAHDHGGGLVILPGDRGFGATRRRTSARTSAWCACGTTWGRRS